MDLTEAIRARHSVRKYTDKPIEAEKTAVIRTAIERINRENGLNIQLVLEEPKAFNGLFITTYGQFSGVKNYLVVAAPKGKEWEEKVGYYGEELVILAQTLGLNTCWAGLTYKKIPGTFTLRKEDVVHCFIALGYGTTPGVQHPQKPMERFYESDGLAPEWFMAGMEAALLAPTAVNQQKFKFILHSGNVVETRTFFSPWGYTRIDLGIVKYHFETGAGKENFTWMNPMSGGKTAVLI
jgi:nitroreductase